MEPSYEFLQGSVIGVDTLYFGRNAGRTRLPQFSRSGIGDTGCIYCTRHTDFLGRKPLSMGVVSSLMCLPRHGESLAVLVIPFVGYIEEGLVSLDCAIQIYFVCNFTQCVEDLVSP